MSHSSDNEKGSVQEIEQVRIGDFVVEKVHDASQLKDVKVVENVQNAAFAAAVKQSNLSPWTARSFTLFCCMFISFLCSCANGYDGSLMTAINAMPYYQAKFNPGTLGSSTGLIFSIYTVGGIVGPWVAGPIADGRFGRRGGMFAGAIIICIGSAVIASSNTMHQFIGGRFLLGFGVSVLTTSAPSYCVEICPPQWRGRMTGFYNCGWFGGSIPAAAITLGTAKIKSDLSWRLPLIFQCGPSVVVIFAVWFLPESPRWLMAAGRDQEARDFLTKYHGSGNPNDPVVELEYIEFKENIAIDGADKRWWDYSELFKTHSARWRSFMVLLMGVFGQFSGNGLGYFNTEIYKAVGYGTQQQFDLNLANSITSAIGAGTGVALADRMPRRGALIWGTFASALMLAANAGFSAKWAEMPDDAKNLNIGRGAVAFYFLFNIVYSFAYTPLQALYPVEVLQTTTRAKGMAMYAVVVSLVGFINTYAGPIALANIGYKYVYIFVGWDLIESVLWYLFGVETVGRTLEELEDIFAAPNPVKESKRVHTVAVKKDGGVVVVGEF
ncbi:hypothetical protein FRB97_002519 [Tulasnella sp. 331]|nr:hypothetical protein FRB97_002519 [Tulasnella sp. 331]